MILPQNATAGPECSALIQIATESLIYSKNPSYLVK
jgi:hypothetical protein